MAGCDIVLWESPNFFGLEEKMERNEPYLYTSVVSRNKGVEAIYFAYRAKSERSG